MKRYLASAGLFILFGLAPLHAQNIEGPGAIHRVEIFWAPYSMLHTSGAEGGNIFHGGNLAIEINLTDNVGLVGDIAAHRQSFLEGIRADIVDYRLGPRFSIRTGRARFFGHLLIGHSEVIGSIEGLSASFGGKSAAAGGGIDLAISRWFSVRLIQADYSYQHFGPPVGATSNGVQVGAGLVFRFGGYSPL